MEQRNNKSNPDRIQDTILQLLQPGPHRNRPLDRRLHLHSKAGLRRAIQLVLQGTVRLRPDKSDPQHPALRPPELLRHRHPALHHQGPPPDRGLFILQDLRGTEGPGRAAEQECQLEGWDFEWVEDDGGGCGGSKGDQESDGHVKSKTVEGCAREDQWHPEFVGWDRKHSPVFRNHLVWIRDKRAAGVDDWGRGGGGHARVSSLPHSNWDRVHNWRCKIRHSGRLRNMYGFFGWQIIWPRDPFENQRTNWEKQKKLKGWRPKWSWARRNPNSTSSQAVL